MTRLAPRLVLFFMVTPACGDDTSSASGTEGGASSGAAEGSSTGEPQTSSSTGLETTSGGTSTGEGSSSGGADTSNSTGAESSGSSGDDASSSSSGGQAVWTAPDCATVTGTGAVTFTSDEGATLAPMDQQLQPVTYTFGLVALGQPGRLVAASGDEILMSDDAGCTWAVIGQVEGGTPVLRGAGDTRAYGFVDNYPVLLRVDDDMVTPLTSPTAEGIVGLGVDPVDPDHLRLGDSAGQLWDSVDAGEHWIAQGVAAVAAPIVYRAFFDPADIDHVIFGVAVQGAWVTTNAGAAWTQSTGFGAGNANVFNLSISGADPYLVWAEGYDLANLEDASARHVFRSEDGGLTFTAVVDADEAILYNGNHLFPHPTDPDVLYFVFGSNYEGYGTDIFRYDHGTETVTLTHNAWDDVAAIAFLPNDPSVMYFGLSVEP